jgi:universal stress protein A
MSELQRILVVTRMSTYCREAIRLGISLARKYEAKLTVLHVMYNPFEHLNMPMMSMEEEHRKDMARERQRLEAVIARERGEGMAITEIVREAAPLEEIVATVTEGDIDLVVLHAHRDRHWEHFLYGYSNGELVRRMPCSIFLVRQGEPE